MFEDYITFFSSKEYDVTESESGDVIFNVVYKTESSTEGAFEMLTVTADLETKLPKQVLYQVISGEGALETESVVTEGQNVVLAYIDIEFSYPVEGTEEFEAFKEVVKLPADEECYILE